ncbi:DUF4947 domain-containing protein [Lactovum odontotermitis]
MEEMVCRHCGGNQFKKIEDGEKGSIYLCLYCGTKYYEDGRQIIEDELQAELEVPDEKAEILISQKKLNPKRFSFYLSMFFLYLGASFAFLLVYMRVETNQKVGNSVDSSSSAVATHPSSWTDSELNNPDQNIGIAEVSLNQDKINKARASVEKFGGAQTAVYTARLDEAQKEHDALVQTYNTAHPAADVLKANEKDDFAVVSYYGEGGMFVAFLPDFGQYDEAQIRDMWGEPDKVITDASIFRKNLYPPQFSESEEAYKDPNNEYYRLNQEWLTGDLSLREQRAYNVGIYDYYVGADLSKELVYQDQGKPNVYLDEKGKASYVTPVLKYLMFPRNGEKYPDKGFKNNYPSSYPENYQFPEGPVASEVK